jgi:hypothetical protein
MYKVVKDQNRRAISVYGLAKMCEGYVPQSTDIFRTTKEGFISLKRFPVKDLLHNRMSWEAMGIRKGMLPLHVSIDPHTGAEVEPFMTMNGMIINPESPEVIRRMQFLITFPGSALLEALGVIEEVFEKYIDDEEGTKKSDNGPFGVLTRLQPLMCPVTSLSRKQ